MSRSGTRWVRSGAGSASVPPRGSARAIDKKVVPVEQLETVSVVHETSRAGDPHWHIHFQIGTRVYRPGFDGGSHRREG